MPDDDINFKVRKSKKSRDEQTKASKPHRRSDSTKPHKRKSRRKSSRNGELENFQLYQNEFV
ncbi:5169_t:CDS:2, partial [Funneliformis mosseae]